jgi:hypothetical protein
MMKRYIEAWDGPVDCTCSTCGAQTRGMELTIFDQRERRTTERKGVFTCHDCDMASRREYQARRKAQLAAMDRCEIPGCQHRGTFRVPGMLICGRHLKRAQREHARVSAGAGILGCMIPMDRETITTWAQS